MGCASSVPVATTTVTPTPPALMRKPSAPVIKIDQSTDPTQASAPSSGASSTTSTAAANDPSVPEGLAKHITPEGVVALHTQPVGDVVSSTAASEGVKGILVLMKAHLTDAEYQWWCCDALASLCAGNEENRASAYVGGGVLQILAAMRVFGWDESVQCKGNWALANMAASYADFVGKQGGVEAVVQGMRNCADSYQVQISGARTLQNLMLSSAANKVRAVKAGAIVLVTEALERNPEDGQLQWRGQQLLQVLDSVTEKDIQRHGGNSEVARNSPWNKLRSAVIAGHAQRISFGNVPGLYGVSAQVAEQAKIGVVAVLNFMRTHKDYHEIETWCCDAISTLCNGNADNRRLAFENGAVEVVFGAMKTAMWDEELQLKCIWALLSLAPADALAIGQGDNMSTIVASLYANRTNHQIQVAGVKLLSLLTIEPTGQNLDKTRAANASRIIKATIAAHSDDGTLQYRGVNLLERLSPGITLDMPKQSMIRSYSMRADEMVSQYKLTARSFMAGKSSSNGEDFDAGSSSSAIHGSTVYSHEQQQASNAAIAEVDEIAEAVVEEGEGHEHEGEEKKEIPGTVQ